MSLDSILTRPTADMTLADFTSSGLVVPHLRGVDAASVIQELSQTLQRERRIPESLPFYHAALNREFMVSTDMEAGIALPHARLPALKEVSFSLGRCDEPLRWGTRAAGAVRLVFLLAVPATDSTQYLLLNSGLVRLSKDAALMARLLTATDAFQMLEVLQQVTLRASPSSDSLPKAVS